MGHLRTALAVILALMGTFFCFAWRPWESLSTFYPWPLVFFIVCLALLSWRHESAEGLLSRLIDLPMRSWIIACAAISFLIATFATFVPLQGIPHVPDDICYLWQARTFAQGRLFMPSHDLSEFFHHLFMINDGKWYSLFQPGWPMLLTPFVYLHMELLVNPILGALAVALVAPIGKRVASERVVKLAMLIMAVSPLHLAISAAQLAHPLTIILTELSVLAVMRLEERNRTADALILGAALGFMFLTRALNTVAMTAVMTIPITVFVLKGRISPIKLLPGLLIAAAFFSLQLAYNNVMTGDPLYWPQDHYFDITEPKPGCHSLGFGTKVGCPNVHPGECFPEGFTPSDAVHVFHKRMGTFLMTLFGWNVLFFFIAVPFMGRRAGWRKYFLLSVFLALIVAYFFWYFHGLWGRYYYEACFAIFLLSVSGLARTHHALVRWSERFPDIAKRVMKSLVPALIIGYLLFTAVIFIPNATYEILAKSFFNVDLRLGRIAYRIPKNSIIFLEDWYQIGFIFMRPDRLEDDRLYVHDMGRHNYQMMQYYPDRQFFKYSTKKDIITPLQPHTEPSPVFVEVEMKAPISDSSGEYAYTDAFTGDEKKQASGKLALTFLADAPDSYVGFQQFIFKDGHYNLQIRLATGPNKGQVRLSVDQRSSEETVDLYAKKPGFILWNPESLQNIELTRGRHRIVYTVTGKHSQSEGYNISVDYMLLELIEKRKP